MAVTSRPCVAIRRHRFPKVFLEDLVGLGSIDLALREFLSAAVRARKNIIICGGVDAGKTTLLRALLNEVPASERIVTIEDNLELGARPLPRPAPRRRRARGPRGERRGRGGDRPRHARAVGPAHEPRPGDRRRGPRPRGHPDAQRHEPGQRRLHVHGARQLVDGRVRQAGHVRHPGARATQPRGDQPHGGQRHQLRRVHRHRRRRRRRRTAPLRVVRPRDRRRRRTRLSSPTRSSCPGRTAGPSPAPRCALRPSPTSPRSASTRPCSCAQRAGGDRTAGDSNGPRDGHICRGSTIRAARNAAGPHARRRIGTIVRPRSRKLLARRRRRAGAPRRLRRRR